MMGRQDRDQGQLFYEFSLDQMIRPDFNWNKMPVRKIGYR